MGPATPVHCCVCSLLGTPPTPPLPFLPFSRSAYAVPKRRAVPWGWRGKGASASTSAVDWSGSFFSFCTYAAHSRGEGGGLRGGLRRVAAQTERLPMSFTGVHLALTHREGASAMGSRPAGGPSMGTLRGRGGGGASQCRCHRTSSSVWSAPVSTLYFSIALAYALGNHRDSYPFTHVAAQAPFIPLVPPRPQQ